MRDMLLNPTLEFPDDDPFLWLEEVDGVRATAWADAQSAATLAAFAGPGFEADRGALRDLLDRPDNLPYPARRGGLIYNFWKDAEHKRGLWRRTTLESYRADAPEWDVLLDLDALAAAEGEDWVWGGATTFPPAHERALVRLSRGGSDAVVVREFDLGTRGFVPGGFSLPEGKGGADWIDEDTLLLSTALGGATRSGYAATVRLWHRGAAWDAEVPVFTTDVANMSAWGAVDRAGGRLLFCEKAGFFETRVWMGDRGGPKQLLGLPGDASFVWDRAGWMAVRGRTPWVAGGVTYAADVVVVIGLEAFLAGARGFRVVFEPTERRALQSMFWSDGVLVLNVLDEARPSYFFARPGEWRLEALAGLPVAGTVSAWTFDVEEAEEDGSLLAVVQDPITPPTLMLTRPLAMPEVLKRLPAGFDASGVVVTRHEAVSSDGERIPYVQTGPAGETGEAPVHLTGYGGFAVSSLPSYGMRTGKLWIEKGGTSVLAQIRGGGEFGTRWHEAGRLAGKRLSHDDFAAVAADLVRRGVTRPGRIAAEGGSNGGHLIANMLVRYPERFGALFCTIPLIDMRRYSRLLAGASWVAEYGDPEKAEDWAFLGPMSAYHTVESGRVYPPILIATTRRDDRVHPGHARKMAAKLQAMGYDARFYEPAAGGHGYGKDNAEVAGFAALGMRFLRESIGWDVG